MGDWHSDPYALDASCDRIYAGDYVECLVSRYFSIKKGERRRVRDIVYGNIVLSNPSPNHPSRTSVYRATNFRLSGRYHPYHWGGEDKRRPASRYNKETEMLYIAIKVPGPGWNYASMANSINNWNDGLGKEGFPITHPHNLIADTSYDSLKERVKAAVGRDPESRWLIVNGNTIAEASTPPVTFRQW